MINLQYLSDNKELAIRLLNARELDTDFRGIVNELLLAEKSRKAHLTELEKRRNEINGISSQISRLTGDDRADAIRMASELKGRAAELERIVEETGARVFELNTSLPNIPHQDIPLSPHKEDKRIVLSYEGRGISEESSVPTHDRIIDSFGLVDWKKGTTASGAQFPYYVGAGALLERALLNYFVDKAVRAGYQYQRPPDAVKERALFVAGTYPKFKNQTYRIESDGLVLVPTAEVAIVGAYDGKLFKKSELPVRVAGETSCFRREAGTSGSRDKGTIRMHQFNKVEKFVFSTPEQSGEMLEELVSQSVEIMKELGLPFQLALLPSGDLGQQCAITYDVEVLIPSYGFIEVSSCSNCDDYQARRGNIKFKSEDGKRKEFVHTLNGSALATSRLLPAIVENFYSSKDGGIIRVPDPLVSYMGTDVIRPARM